MTFIQTTENLLFRKNVKLGAVEPKWIAEISMSNYTTKHKPEKANGNIDYLSRYPVEEPRGLDEDDVIPICYVSATAVPK